MCTQIRRKQNAMRGLGRGPGRPSVWAPRIGLQLRHMLQAKVRCSTNQEKCRPRVANTTLDLLPLFIQIQKQQTQTRRLAKQMTSPLERFIIHSYLPMNTTASCVNFMILNLIFHILLLLYSQQCTPVYHTRLQTLQLCH